MFGMPFGDVKMAQDQSRLDTWKQIAEYLKKDVRTVKRWEAERGLPVHRLPGAKRSSVYAWPSEIDRWLDSGGTDRTRLDGNGNALASQPSLSDPPMAAARARPSPHVRLLALGSVLVLAVVISLLSLSPRPRAPRLGGRVQVTGDGLQKTRAIAGATSLFFSTQGERGAVVRTSLDGGEESQVYSSANGTALLGLSLSASELLIRGSDGISALPTSGGPPRRLAAGPIDTADWSRDGRKLAYIIGRELYLANSNGSDAHRLVTLPFSAGGVRWSPEGKRIRLCSIDRMGYSKWLWEVSVENATLHRLLPGWSRTEEDAERQGNWTPDGKYFVFPARHNGTNALWAIREKEGWLDWGDHGPFQLAASLDRIDQPSFSRDGKRLFAIVDEPERGELMRYDPVAHRFTPYLGQTGLGLSAAQVSFSPDGQQVAYVRYPQGSLWRMNLRDGSERKLAERAFLPRWSPDGTRIAFMHADEDIRKPAKICVISASGGRPQQPVQSPEWQGAPTWTADGKALIFGDNAPQFPVSASCTIHIFDLRTRRNSELPGSSGLWTARTCPTGRFVAALTRDDAKLVLYDLRTANWTQLASFPDSPIGDNPTWSRDGNFIYFDAPRSANPAIYRISVQTRHIECVASLKGLQRQLSNGDMGLWIGLTPDNRPLILRAVQSNDIHAWNWIEP